MKLPVITHPEQDDAKLRNLGVSLTTFLDTVRERKDKTYTIRIRIIFKRFPKYYTTKISMDENAFLQLLSTKPNQNLKKNKIVIYELLKKAYDIIIGMSEFSFRAFEKKFLDKSGDWSNVYFAFDTNISNLTKNEKHKTAETYVTARNSFQNFDSKKKLLFDDITVQWLKRYEGWMFSKGLSSTTISINVRCLRRLYNIAIGEGDARKENYPYGRDDMGKYEPPQHNNVKKALPKNDIEKIFKYKPIQGSTEAFYRDLWIFSYLCNGMNMSDICRLKFKNISGSTIVFIRQKTSFKRKHKPIQVEINDYLQEIIDNWGDSNKLQENYVFKILIPKMDEKRRLRVISQTIQMCNKHMRVIAKKIKIDDSISTYSARHSFASVLKLAGEDIAYISESLGHSNLQTTENYLSSFDSKKRKEASKKLMDWD